MWYISFVETIRIDQENQIDLKQQVIDLYLQSFAMRRTDSKSADIILEKIDAILRAYFDPTKFCKILSEAKKQHIHYPHGMFLSEKAFERVLKESGKYLFFPDYSDGYQFINFTLRKSPEMVLGHTRFYYLMDRDIAEVSQYCNDSFHYPGAGLLMLIELQRFCKIEGVRKMSLTTRKIPRGLGNIGFEYVDDGLRTTFRYQWQNPEV
jgi:hypothetical protein